MVNSFHLRTSLIRMLLFPALGTLTKCQFLKPKIEVARAQCAIAQMLKCENVCPIAVVITKTSFSRPPGTDIFTITTSWKKRTHDQNVVTTKLSGQTQDSNET